MRVVAGGKLVWGRHLMGMEKERERRGEGEARTCEEGDERRRVQDDSCHGWRLCLPANSEKIDYWCCWIFNAEYSIYICIILLTMLC